MSPDQNPELEWPRVDFEADPRLVLGGRPRKGRLGGQRVDVHEDVFADLRSVGETAYQLLAATTARAYDPNATLEVGEQHFLIPISELPKRALDKRVDEAIPERQASRVPPSGQSGTPTDEVSDLIEMIQGVDQLEAASRPQVRESEYLFYAICWPCPNGFLGFVKKSNPRKALHAGRKFYKFEDTLKSVSTPDLALDSDVDVIISPTLVAGFSAIPIKDLFADIRIVFDGVRTNVGAIQSDLENAIPLLDESAAALTNVGERKLSVARRIYHLPSRLSAIGLTLEKFRSELTKQCVDESLLVDSDGQLDFGPDRVELFLDVVEGRFYRDGLGGEDRRADRFSRRRN